MLTADPSPGALAGLQQLRHTLHARPELSGAEGETARTLRNALVETQPDQVIEGLAGHGLALVYDSGAPGPSVLFRAELDALPITEASGVPHASRRAGVAHLCGHDGHMAILAGMARHVGQHRPPRGRVVLLFQPAEETGAGARAVLADPRFGTLAPDWAFALHNMPGMELGHITVAPGPASCASVGLHLRWQGREAHAATPESGLSPAPSLAALMALIAPHAIPGALTGGFRQATLCHLSMGARAFGIAPARAEAMLTLRTITDSALAAFEAEIRNGLQSFDLSPDISRHDHFNATDNDPQAAAHITRAATGLGIPEGDFPLPMRPSEDFGAFSATTRTGLFFLGSGRDHPALHDPHYDFPDPLIAPGVALFARIMDQVMRD
ncbi:MAG: amidohydrolase [Rhodobacteraceae bacterium]|nr:amidohydrolase [Paracoccaceae bacterium]TVR47336.1 MAG: amidohydrolase [Paracoccaceae bacterium]